MAKFELLPNEILMQCFKYLDAINIFYSFNDLNFRFNSLIRQIPLHIRLEHVKKCALISFCQKLSADVQVTNRIKSLKISEKGEFNAVGYFLSSISLDKLTELEALTFNHLDTKTAEQILPALPFLTKLKYYGGASSSSSTYDILASLPASNIQTLSLKSACPDITHAFTSVVNLTVFYCSLEQLYAFFQCSPMLQDVKIECLLNYSDSPPLSDSRAVYLNRLIINQWEKEFTSLETLLQRTPNLKSLAIISHNIDEVVDAHRWQRLITTSLPHLNVFKFQFVTSLKHGNDVFVDEFLQFQTDFWHQQHHWFTEYVLNQEEGYIYTVPYLSNEYKVKQDQKRYRNKLNKHVQTFANVTDLTLSLDGMTYAGEYYFPNVRSLRLTHNDGENSVSKEPKQMKYLKRMVNLTSITHLEISSECQWNSPSMILQILQQATSLSSLKIDKEKLIKLLKYFGICRYFTKMIRKLVTTNNSAATFDDSAMLKICQTFPDLEEFHCFVGRSDNLHLLFNNLSKLLHLRRFSYKIMLGPSVSEHDWLEEHKLKLDSLMFFVEYECIYSPFYSNPYSRDCTCSCAYSSHCTSCYQFYRRFNFNPSERYGYHGIDQYKDYCRGINRYKPHGRHDISRVGCSTRCRFR